MNYWQRKANTWVSVSVLAGGLTAAIMIAFIYRVQSDFQTASASAEDSFWVQN